ncbi:histidinol-phosphate transaminase [Aristaeella hokkaidonensis]|uniref:Histidinol-phosphate transaminase n=1 Tax=Aristaeella hokkaidonensis TaxID=3046382 RepID=A0AC61MYY1_9FIRM|nr:histidinol-phosphate transaminase [Aristaeella hokkaidonensis]QUC68372.1 histidinol-phosphate transaminase [Aristaeella hokkaidonensis]SNT95064.1 histidinol-phosphate aminotransferase [Aristaeella hokkaidonensis]
MSRFFSDKYKDLEPYTPGEQPREQKYIKLNTNENPYPPLPEVAEAVRKASDKLYLYSDTECVELRKTLAERLNVSPDELLMTNGSDEILNFAFMAFCDKHTPAYFADITYGFYPVFADINQVPYEEIPLKEDLTIDISDYFQKAGTIFIANPNAPTAIALRRSEIEEILKQNLYNVVVVDEAYVDFGAESCVPLIKEYDNLLVTQTFSKSRSMAGARLGMGIGNPELIRDLNAIKYSINPYNVNSLTSAAGVASLKLDEYNMKNCEIIMETRSRSERALRELGFEMTTSQTNFLFARHPDISGEDLYLELKKKGILIRHFSKERIKDYNRITVGTPEQMEKLTAAIKQILEEKA